MTLNIHTQVADVLAAARGLIEERGWWQGKPKGPRGEVCALTALDIAVPDRALLWEEAKDALLDAAIGRGRWRFAVSSWNDAPGRTQAEVLAAFETAEANERRRAEA